MMLMFIFEDIFFLVIFCDLDEAKIPAPLGSLCHGGFNKWPKIKKKQVGLQPMSGVMGLDDSNSQTQKEKWSTC